MYYVLKLGKTSVSFTQQLPAMLAVGAFEVVGEYEILDDAYEAHVALMLTNLREKVTGVHYEIADETGKVNDFPGVYANRETLKGLAVGAHIEADHIAQEVERIKLFFTPEQRELSPIRAIEKLAGLPLKTLDHLLSGRRGLPPEHLQSLLKVLIKVGYAPLTEIKRQNMGEG